MDFWEEQKSHKYSNSRLVPQLYHVPERCSPPRRRTCLTTLCMYSRKRKRRGSARGFAVESYFCNHVGRQTLDEAIVLFHEDSPPQLRIEASDKACWIYINRATLSGLTLLFSSLCLLHPLLLYDLGANFRR